ncbi:biopolymer transporter ExbD [uncultured Roseobacter sp.]|uniref:ExbD/TolR family protein n=1 Tax=uncultured Roseobacter sp. TaxID=114847 RepID=UPI002615CA3B|nr:biopolymer transporter ExbD [uncultured Roseobacter sp.]
MDLSDPPKRRRVESIVPMINVVFLLLIFFLMTSQLATQPFDVTPPEASIETDGEAEPVLFLDESGRMSFDGVEGEAALLSLAARSSEMTIIQLRADARLEATRLARILSDLGAAGLSRVELVLTPK